MPQRAPTRLLREPRTQDVAGWLSYHRTAAAAGLRGHASVPCLFGFIQKRLAAERMADAAPEDEDTGEEEGTEVEDTDGETRAAQYKALADYPRSWMTACDEEAAGYAGQRRARRSVHKWRLEGRGS